MSHKESTKAFPDQQYNGSAEGYDNYDADKLSWAITNNYDEHLESVDPSTIPRVDAAYTVPANDNDDPHGPPGTNVPRETQAAYDRRIAKDKKDGKTIWAGGLRGMKDDARESFLATEQFNARAAFAKVEENHGNQTEKQVSTLVRKFNTTNKKRNQTIENFNDDWRRGLRAMKSNAMELPPKYVVNLYLAALGSPYKTLESMIQVLPSTQRTISKVMQLAKDHIVEDNDEADVNMAMAAKHKRKYHESAYAAQQQKGGCTVCHHPYHTQEECFRQGGGLAHLTREQRQQHLHAKRTKRAASRFYQQNQHPHPPAFPQYPPPSHQYHNQSWQQQQPPLPPQQQPKNHQEHANLAKELEEAKTKIAQQELTMASAKARIHDTLGYELELGY